MKKYLIVLLSAVMIISCTVVLAACGSTDSNKPNTPNTPQEQTQQLTTPTNLAVNNATASWVAVANANGYTVRIGTTEHQVASGTTFDLSSVTLAEGTYQVSVKAVGQTVGNIRYTDSAYSSPVDYVVKATVKEGTYRLTTVTFDGKTYDVTKADEARDFYKTLIIKGAILELQAIYPGYDFNSIIVLKFFFADELDFTGITTAAQFWDAFIELFISTDQNTEDGLNNSIKGITTAHLIINNNIMTAYDEQTGLSAPTAFTLNNGVITLANPSAVGMTSSTLTYTDGVITETATNADLGFILTLIATYELIPAV
ncbi:MAG: hypothetical protein FWF37_00985 [Chloroflexi bacterium]|nr:hypothetical protein [Chloroflexota bacterium]